MEIEHLVVGCIAACLFGSCLFGVFEFVAAAAFLRPIFRIGPRALESDEVADLPPGLLFAASGETAHAKYRVIPGHTCLFRRKYRLFEMRCNTPLEIKGTISWADGHLRTAGRYPLGTVAFFASWLLMWTGVNLSLLLSGQLEGVAFLLVGWLCAGPMIEVSRSIALQQFRQFSAEVHAALLATPPGSGVRV